jgi:hypothetical protein
VANAFLSGVVFVDLSTAPAAADVVPTIARALGLSEVGTRVRVDRPARYLSTREVLLVLDNFEHVLRAALASVPSGALRQTRLKWGISSGCDRSLAEHPREILSKLLNGPAWAARELLHRGRHSVTPVHTEVRE